MKRVLTATCLAAAFAVGLAAQSTGTSGTAGTAAGQDPQANAGQRGGPRTVTGCLRAGDTAGTYMLTDVIMPGGAGRRGGDATSTGATTAGSATGTSTAGATGTGTAAQGRTMPPQSIMLTAASDVDLKPHVGHKVEVTGTLAGGRDRGTDAGASATGTATGTGTTGTTTTGAGTTATGTATGTGTGTGATTGGQATGRGGPRSMTVTTIRMISESCS
jgi:hypothetical protein